MPFKRTNSCVAVGVLFLLLVAAPALGQGPLGLQLFAPADLSTYGGEPEPNEGYFFQFDLLYWSISGPQVRTIGYPGTNLVYYGPHPTDDTDPQDDTQVQGNTLDTGGITDKFSVGNRIEFGRIENRSGWLVSIYQQRDQTQENLYTGAGIVFYDPESAGSRAHPLIYGNVNADDTTDPPYTPPFFARLPVVFSTVWVQNAVDTWGVEADYLHRFRTGHGGGTFELLLGARYYEFNDNFKVVTGPDDGTTTVPSFLSDSYWYTQAANHVIGPQVGIRWFKKQGRWSFNTEGRFFAGFNCQTITQQACIGPNLDPGPNNDGTYQPFEPVAMASVTGSDYAYKTEFTPGIELRLEATYQITRAISFRAGWTGMWMNNIARANGLIDYTITDLATGAEQALGIDMTNNCQNLFVNGVTIGFDVNR